MNKWSYAAAMMLAISSGCIFTGCIDNDEPYGIEQIRVATASLLEAKKNAVAAEAAAANANLEIAKIQAEIDKLKVENEKIIAESQAKINEAQAEAQLLKAKAEAAVNEALAAQYNAEAEEALARANDQKAKTEAYIKDQEATLNEKIGLAEANVKTAQLEYDKALYAFEQEKAKHLSEANDALWGAVAGAFDEYLADLDAYNQANRKYLKAVQELAKQNTNIEWNGDKFTSLAWDQKTSIEKEIARINNDLAIENNNVAEVEEFNQKLADIKDADPKGLYTLLSDYEDKLTDATAAKTEAEAALQALKLNNKDIMEAPENIQKEITALYNKKMDVPAWSYEPIPQLQPLGAPWDQPQVIVPEHQTYTFNDQTSYQNWVNVYQTAINRISSVFLDDNDKLWTQATLNELGRKINPLAQKVTKAWSNAKEVYNMGNAAQADKAPLGAEVKAAADASNAANTALLASNRAYYAAEAAYDEAVVAYNEALGKYNQAASDAYQAASEKYDADREKIDATYEAAEKAAREARDLADAAIPGKIDALEKTELKDTGEAYEAALVAANGNEEDPKVVAAKAAYDAALAKRNALYGEYSTNWDVYEKAVEKATEQQRKDLDAATKAWVAAQETWAHAYDADVINADPMVKPSYTEKEEKDKAMQEALEAYVEQKEATNEAYGKFQDVRSEQLTAINKMYNGDYNFYYDDPNESNGRSVSYAIYQLSNFKAAENATSPEVIIPFAYQVDGVYTIAKAYIVNASQYTFGRLGDWGEYDYGTDYNQDLAILLPIDFAKPMDNQEAIFKVFNDYVIAINQYTSPWSYQQEYWRFGAYSQVLVDMYDYNIGKVCVANDFESIINDLLAEPKANLEGMETAHKEVAEQIDEKNREYADAEKAAQDLTDAAQANIDAAQETWTTINQLIGTLKQGIAQLEAIAVGAMPTYDAAQVVEGMIEANNEKLAAAQKLIEELNAQLEEVNYIKGQYEGENGYASLINPYTYQVDYLKTKVENAKALMEFAKARYEELQAKYDAANK